MSIEAPVSRHKKSNLKIYIWGCIIAAIVLGYDGYLSKYEWSRRQSFYNKHCKDGKADATMVFNRTVPVGLAVLAALMAGRLQMLQKGGIVAEENELCIGGKKKIPYQSIQSIDKTHFDSKGYFIITYNDSGAKEVNLKLSDGKYDNLAAVLEEVVKKIT